MKLFRKRGARFYSRIAMACMIVAGIGFGAYMYFTYNGIITGDIKLKEAPELLTRLDITRFEKAVDHRETRESIPYPDPEARNPFVRR